MSKRILLALMAIVMLSSAAFGGTWANTAHWVSGAWQSTKNFFTDDIPSYFGHWLEWAGNWWNNSNSKKLDSLLEGVAEIKAMLADISPCEKELAERERKLAERERAAVLRENALASRDAELTARERALQEDLARVAESNSRQQEAAEKAAKIHAKLSGDKYLSKFLEAGMLLKMDVERFMLYDKSYGAVNIPNTPYGILTANLDTAKFGFVDVASLKNALKTLFRANTFSLRGNSAVVLVLSDDKTNWNGQIDSVSDKAFFTIEGLSAELNGLMHSANTTETKIASFLKENELNGRLRMFFRTRHEGLYVLVLMDNENTKPVIYLAADSSQKLINRRDLPRVLRSSIELRSSGREAALYFGQEDNKIDIYLDKFVTGIVEKIPGYKD